MNVPTQDLIDNWLDRSTAEDASILARRLLDDPNARAELVRSARFEADLWRTLTPPPPLPPHRFTRGTWLIWATLGIMTILTAIAVIGHRGQPPLAADVVAGTVVADGKILSRVAADQVFQVVGNSEAALRLADGSMIYATPQTSMSIRMTEDGRGAFVGLDAGAARFRLVPGCRGFDVSTPVATTRALGPQFELALRGIPPVLDVSVTHGGVRVRRARGDDNVDGQGQRRTFRGNGT
jgi:hypothetical protein